MSTGLKRYLDDLPHPTVRRQPVEGARHRSFIVSGLIVGLLSLSLLPITLAVMGPLSAAELAVLGLIVGQAPLAILLSVTGWFRLAAMAAVTMIGGSVVLACSVAGCGYLSPVMLWLAVMIAEAVVAARASVLLYAVAAAAAVLAWPALQAGSPAGTMALRMPTAMETMLGALALVQLLTIAFRVHFLTRFIDTQISDRDHRFRAFTEAMPDTMITLSTDGTVGYVTPSVVRVLGLSSRDLLGRSFFDRLHIADRPAVLKALSDTDGEVTGQADFRLNVATSFDDQQAPRWQWLELRISKMPPAADRGVTRAFPLVATLRDVTRRIALETELHEAVEEARTASQSKTRFLASVSHELRTPLNAIIGFSDMLKQELHGKMEYDHQREYAGLINDSGEHLLQMVNDILDSSRIEAGQFAIEKEAFEIGDLVRNCCQMMGPQAEKRQVKIRSEVDGNLPELVADRRACRQVLLNLLHNAIKFSHEGGSIAVTAEKVGQSVVLSVIDRGIGIAPDLLPKLGRPFVQADTGYNRSHEGAGLGLSLVRGLVELHGGRMALTSALGKGTRVEVRLPLGNAEEDKAAASVVDLSARRQALSA